MRHRGSALLDAPRPGGYVAEDEHFVVEHAPLGSVLHRLVPAIKAATGVQRVYYLAVMEHSPHFHLWLVPKKNVGELMGADYLAQRPPLTASYGDAEAMVGKIRATFESS